jgi:hypothetical protein
VRRVARYLPRYRISASEQTPEQWTANRIDEWLKQSLAFAGKAGSERREEAYVRNNHGHDPKTVRAQIAAQTKERAMKISISLIKRKVQKLDRSFKNPPSFW